jgi:uncharacterized Zn finger protein
VVADKLLAWLADHAPSKDWDYRRQNAVRMAADALDSAKRRGEIAPLLEDEARRTGQYLNLVNRLLTGGKFNDAERWIREGIANLAATQPGTVHALQEKMIEILERRKDWLSLAGHRAESFLLQPSLISFTELLAAARRAGCEAATRAGALAFLETGLRPDRPITARDKAQSAEKSSLNWPLSTPDYLKPPPAGGSANRRPLREEEPRPYPDVLLEIAIAENRPDDALAIYEQHLARQRVRPSHYGFEYRNDHRPELAEFVTPSHPQRAAELYERLALEYFEQTGDGAYESGVNYLKKLRPILERLNQQDRWLTLIAGIRDQQRRKRNLIAKLDRLDAKPIISDFRR